MPWGKFLFSFNGRITRKAYWLFIAASLVLNILLSLISPDPGITPDMDPAAAWQAAMDATPVWQWPYMIVMFIIGLAVATKRWHDQDRSGWWNLLLLLTPLLFIGPLIMLIMLGFIGGTPGPNRYGEEPMV